MAPGGAAQEPGWPHLTLVCDRAVGLGLGAVAVGAGAQQAWLPRVLLPGIRASRLVILCIFPVFQLGGLLLGDFTLVFILCYHLPLFLLPFWLHLCRTVENGDAQVWEQQQRHKIHLYFPTSGDWD